LAVFGLTNYIIGALLYILGGAIAQLDGSGFAEVWIVASVNLVIAALSLMPWHKWHTRRSQVDKGGTDGRKKEFRAPPLLISDAPRVEETLEGGSSVTKEPHNWA
jgi:hypothetical protein